MTCDELREQYELYALGVLDVAERAELDAHLHIEGDPCINGVRRARELMTTLALTAPESHPPTRLRKKVMGLVGAPKRTWNWTRACSALIAWGLLFMMAMEESFPHRRMLAHSLDAARQE